ncbi:MAG: SAVED domain-containing protein, partial [Acidobacteriota bacterium]
PRGHPSFSKKLAKDISNLMLMCDKHHRLIDKEQVAEHPVKRLTRMKALHEARIELVTSIHPNMRSEVLMYGANIGAQDAPVSYRSAVEAMLPKRYPASANGISLGLKNSGIVDRDKDFWKFEEQHLRRQFTEHIKPRLFDKSVEHLSIFAFAPQPLLILLGALLSDIPAADVYQRHREPVGWAWKNSPQKFNYSIEQPKSKLGPPALVLALSATITNDRIASVLNSPSIWRVTIPAPNNDFLKSKQQLQQFREVMRPLLDRIKASHGKKATIHVFPAAPVSINVELGRILMPKADLPLRIYDQNKGAFSPAMDINAGGRS